MWWCEHYKRPLKDPLLLEYSIEELVYEYYLVNEKEEYRNTLAEEEADKIEEAKLEEDDEWADMMEAEFGGSEDEPEPKPEKEPQKAPIDPSTDPKNTEWMEKHIEDNKLFFGDDFGEDLNIDFDNPEKGK